MRSSPGDAVTEQNLSSAIALDSVTRGRGPLPVVNVNNFTHDHRTRVAFFGINMQLNAGESARASNRRSELDSRLSQ